MDFSPIITDVQSFVLGVVAALTALALVFVTVNVARWGYQSVIEWFSGSSDHGNSESSGVATFSSDDYPDAAAPYTHFATVNGERSSVTLDSVCCALCGYEPIPHNYEVCRACYARAKDDYLISDDHPVYS